MSSPTQVFCELPSMHIPASILLSTHLDLWYYVGVCHSLSYA
jgi:hypothetical protein